MSALTAAANDEDGDMIDLLRARVAKLERAGRQALEALDDLIDCGVEAWGKQHPCVSIGIEALEALRQALEAELVPDCHQLGQQDEPVASASAWFALVMNAAAEIEDASNCLQDADAKRVATSAAKHYRNAANALYIRPQPSAQWVGLTDEERQAVFESLPNALDGFLKLWGWLHFSKAVEAKLREKNAGAQARKPLTDARVAAIAANYCLNVGDWTRNGESVARAIERAHGIGDAT
jgi:hypothetical protein